MTRWLCFLMIAAAAMAGTSVSAATLRSKDGKTYTGAITLVDGQFSIATADGQTIAVAPGNVASLDMRDADGQGTTTAPATTAPAAGTGLRGEYFADATFTNSQIVRGDPRIVFNFEPPRQPIAPGDVANIHPMSVRWTGRIRPEFSEKYDLFTVPDSLTRVWIDHRLIMNIGQLQAAVNFEAGKEYELRVDWIDRDRAQSPMLEWASKSLPRQPISSDCLLPPEGQTPMPPTVRLISPGAGIVLAGPVNVPLSAAIEPGTSTPVQVAYRDREALIGTTKSAPFDLVWSNAPMGDHDIIATVTDADGTTGASTPLHVVIGSDAGQTLPKPWITSGVPSAGLPPPPLLPGQPPAPPAPPAAADAPAPTFQNGALALKAVGGDVYAQDDNFRFVFQRLVGDGSIVAHLADLSADPKGSRPLAGVMIRNSLLGTSPYAAMLVVPKVGHVFLCRHNPGDEATNTSSPGDVPIWLRITRKGYTVRVYRSADGKKWEFMGETQLTMPSSMLVGAIVCGGDTGVTASAGFDHLTVSNDTGEDANPFQPTVVLTDGSRLVGTVTKTAKGIAMITTPAGDGGVAPSIPKSAIARMLYRPVSAEALSALTDAQTGVFLDNGDFYEGEIDDFVSDRLTVNSVVFGPRDFGTNDICGVILHAVAKPAGVEVDLFDGSAVQSTTLSVDAKGIELQSTAAGTVVLPMKSVERIITH